MKYSDTKTLRRLARKDQDSRIPGYSLDPEGFHVFRQVRTFDGGGMIRVAVIAKMRGGKEPRHFILDVQAADYLALPDSQPTTEESRT